MEARYPGFKGGFSETTSASARAAQPILFVTQGPSATLNEAWAQIETILFAERLTPAHFKDMVNSESEEVQRAWNRVYGDREVPAVDDKDVTHVFKILREGYSTYGLQRTRDLWETDETIGDVWRRRNAHGTELEGPMTIQSLVLAQVYTTPPSASICRALPSSRVLHCSDGRQSSHWSFPQRQPKSGFGPVTPLQMVISRL